MPHTLQDTGAHVRCYDDIGVVMLRYIDHDGFMVDFEEAFCQRSSEHFSAADIRGRDDFIGKVSSYKTASH